LPIRAGATPCADGRHQRLPDEGEHRFELGEVGVDRAAAHGLSQSAPSVAAAPRAPAMASGNAIPIRIGPSPS
jgi:hypothetical protein